MSRIKFNQLTKEIEIRGSESFIESNFGKIQDQLVNSIGVKEMIGARKTTTNREPIAAVNIDEPQVGAAIEKRRLSDASPTSPDSAASLQEISPELKANRPPLRKYIRKEGIPGHQRMVVEVVEQKPKEISIASLKEKFGLSESKIEGIIRDAEKLGKIKKVMHGSYVWAED